MTRTPAVPRRRAAGAPDGRRGSASRLAACAAGALAARAALRALGALPGAAALARTNFRGRTVTLAGGPALAVGATAAAALGAPSRPTAAAALTAGLGAAAVGLYDDVVGARPEQKADKGFRGHLGALRDGRVTSGLVKIVGVGGAALAASALVAAGAGGRRGPDRPAAWPPGRRPLPRRSVPGTAVDVLLGAGVIAGTANLLNLLDLRPGRALKAGLLLGGGLLPGPGGGLAAGPVGAAAGLLPADLDERVMLGDCGANALGALLGVALAERTGRAGRAAVLAGLVALTAASERVSFTRVIERTAGLRALDALGRRRD